MQNSYFITGTDTNVGKTWATLTLMQYFKNQGLTVVGMKPVAAGCVWQDGRLVNSDALLMQQHSNIELTYRQINPYAYQLPVSPHIAGRHDPVSLELVCSEFKSLAEQAQCLLVEGVGGWYSPLSDTLDNSDLAKALALPVIIVVAIRLGCLNHAKLTYQAVVTDGLNCAGWIAMCVDADMLFPEQNIATLQKQLPVPLVGKIPNNSVGCFKEWAKIISI